MHITEALIDRETCGLIVQGSLAFVGGIVADAQPEHSHLLLRLDQIGARFQVLSDFKKGADGFYDTQVNGPQLYLKDITRKSIGETIPQPPDYLFANQIPEWSGNQLFAGPNVGVFRADRKSTLGPARIARVVKVILNGEIVQSGLILTIQASLDWNDSDGDGQGPRPSSALITVSIPSASIQLLGLKCPRNARALWNGNEEGQITLLDHVAPDDALTSLCVPNSDSQTAYCRGSMETEAAGRRAILAESIVAIKLNSNETEFRAVDRVRRFVGGFFAGDTSRDWLRIDCLDPILIWRLLSENRDRGSRLFEGNGLGFFYFYSGLSTGHADRLSFAEQVIRSLKVEIAIRRENVQFRIRGELEPINADTMRQFEDRVSTGRHGKTLPESRTSFTVNALVPVMLIRLRSNWFLQN